jgi:hypothetical protein
VDTETLVVDETGNHSDSGDDSDETVVIDTPEEIWSGFMNKMTLEIGRKTGRIVTHLIFIFSQKPLPKQETAVAKPPKQPLPEPDGKSPFRLAKAPIPPKTQADYLKLRTAGEIELCIERANEYGDEQEKAGKPVRYGALYRKAVTEGWHEEKARQKAKQAEDTARKEASRQAAKEAKRVEAEKAGRSKIETELAAAWFSALPDDEKKTLGIAYVAESNPFDVGSFKRKGYQYMGFQFFVKRKWLEHQNPCIKENCDGSHAPAREPRA